MAGKIYITGDVHGDPISKFDINRFPEKDLLDKKDYVIVAGDFGLLWDGSSAELERRDWLEKQKFTTLFVDGNHENFEMLGQLPTKQWNGGEVGVVSESILHLKRGNVYTIHGKKFFVMGGGASIDRVNRIPYISWWREEIPNSEEYNFGINNLIAHDWKVDYIVTHSAPSRIVEQHMQYFKEYNNSLNNFLNLILEDATFKHWYFGHYHDDIRKHNYTMLYEKIVKINRRNENGEQN